MVVAARGVPQQQWPGGTPRDPRSRELPLVVCGRPAVVRAIAPGPVAAVALAPLAGRERLAGQYQLDHDFAFQSAPYPVGR